jgi:hypothetical protein
MFQTWRASFLGVILARRSRYKMLGRLIFRWENNATENQRDKDAEMGGSNN